MTLTSFFTLKTLRFSPHVREQYQKWFTIGVIHSFKSAFAFNAASLFNAFRKFLLLCHTSSESNTSAICGLESFNSRNVFITEADASEVNSSTWIIHKYFIYEEYFHCEYIYSRGFRRKAKSTKMSRFFISTNFGKESGLLLDQKLSKLLSKNQPWFSEKMSHLYPKSLQKR